MRSLAGSLFKAELAPKQLINCPMLCPFREHELPKEDILKTPRGDVFVRAHKQKGILPEILEELLGARKRAKADLKAASDPFKKAVLDGRQLALKVRGLPACHSS